MRLLSLYDIVYLLILDKISADAAMNMRYDRI